MTATTLLTDLCQRGVRLRLTDDRLRILVPRDALTPDLRQTMLAVKPQLIRLLELTEEYRRLLRQAFKSDQPEPDPQAARRRFADEQVRLVDELGPPLAGALAVLEARAWLVETGACPACDDGRCQVCAEPEAK
ncbi:MAG TPA: hypothetical protein VML54_12910 [Candidatus Limnocylindrales bacterium]|nr:hypothetical protein [Candidatus Limnocylindrales bacterium]